MAKPGSSVIVRLPVFPVVVDATSDPAHEPFGKTSAIGNPVEAAVSTTSVAERATNPLLPGIVASRWHAESVETFVNSRNWEGGASATSSWFAFVTVALFPPPGPWIVTKLPTALATRGTTRAPSTIPITSTYARPRPARSIRRPPHAPAGPSPALGGGHTPERPAAQLGRPLPGGHRAARDAVTHQPHMRKPTSPRSNRLAVVESGGRSVGWVALGARLSIRAAGTRQATKGTSDAKGLDARARRGIGDDAGRMQQRWRRGRDGDVHAARPGPPDHGEERLVRHRVSGGAGRSAAHDRVRQRGRRDAAQPLDLLGCRVGRAVHGRALLRREDRDVSGSGARRGDLPLPVRRASLDGRHVRGGAAAGAAVEVDQPSRSRARRARYTSFVEAPCRRATSAAASRRRTPARTSSRAASASDTGSTSAADSPVLPPTTIAISPRPSRSDEHTSELQSR